MAINDGMMSSNKHDWETPPEVFKPLDAEFNFQLDVCANHQNAKVPAYFTEEEDGLAQDWTSCTCWMNPPYGREIADWVQKAHLEAERGALVVALLPARTDTRWFHDHIWDIKYNGPRPWVREIRFLKGRIRFVGAPTSAPFPSMIVVFGGRDEKDYISPTLCTFGSL